MHTRALHAHAGADGVDILFARRDGDLRTFTGFTRDALDLHSPVVNLGNFRLEQVLNQCWVGARNDDLRPLRCLFNLDDDHADTIANRKVLELRLLAPRQFSFSLAELDNNVAVFETLHDAVHDFADVLVVLGVHALALRFADFLKNDLFGHLRRDAAKAHRRLLELEFFFELNIGLHFARFIQRDFAAGVQDRVHYLLHRKDIDFARFRIDAAAQVFVGLEVFARSHNDRVFDRMDDDLRIDPFFSADLIDRLKQHVRHQYSLPAFVTIGPTPLFCRPVEFESRLFNHVQRYLHQIALRRFQSDFPAVES